MPPDESKSTHQVVFGDSRQMGSISSESIELIVTSPPYWQLKDYGVENQIGFNDSYESYVNHLNVVWMECARVLRPGCRLCVNIGDQFARTAIYGRYKVIPIRTEIIRFCETIGLDYMGAIIWQKVTTTNTTGGATIMGSFPFPRNGILKIDYEFILLFKKPGKAPPPSSEAKETSALSTEEWNQYFAGHWNFSGEKNNRHLAPFPKELPHRLIRMFTFPGETVLDPFLGSGTTTTAAIENHRNSIGYEINRDFRRLIEERVSSEVDMFKKYALDFHEETDPVEAETLISKLPYYFSDPVRLNTLVDPRKLHFGSRISMDQDNKKDRHLKAARVLSPTTIKTREGLRIALIGVREKKETNGEAISLLESMVLSKNIFLRFDPIIQSSGEPIWAYVYLQNKTFVNRKLIESGFYELDSSQVFEKKQLFESLKTI